MTDIPLSWNKRTDLRAFRFLLKLFPEDFLEEYEYWLIQTFKDQINDTASRKEYFYPEGKSIPRSCQKRYPGESQPILD